MAAGGHLRLSRAATSQARFGLPDVSTVGDDDEMTTEPLTIERLRVELTHIDSEREYFAFTLIAEPDGRARWSWQSEWISEGEKMMWEMRVPSLVEPEVMGRLWHQVGETYVVVNNDHMLALFLRMGGNALVAREVAESRLARLMEPVECVPGSLVGIRNRSDVPSKYLNRAPTPKLRMDVLRRDDFKCRICGRRPADDVDIVLHVHHIRPHSAGGLTEIDNLITLCHTCHIGLDPHFELRLLGLVPIEISIPDVKESARTHADGVRRYRELVRRVSR